MLHGEAAGGAAPVCMRACCLAGGRLGWATAHGPQPHAWQPPHSWVRCRHATSPAPVRACLPPQVPNAPGARLSSSTFRKYWLNYDNGSIR